jgi:hypothetical protein
MSVDEPLHRGITREMLEAEDRAMRKAAEDSMTRSQRLTRALLNAAERMTAPATVLYDAEDGEPAVRRRNPLKTNPKTILQDAERTLLAIDAEIAELVVSRASVLRVRDLAQGELVTQEQRKAALMGGGRTKIGKRRRSVSKRA